MLPPPQKKYNQLKLWGKMYDDRNIDLFQHGSKKICLVQKRDSLSLKEHHTYSGSIMLWGYFTSTGTGSL